jgi:hypothetical protein
VANKKLYAMLHSKHDEMCRLARASRKFDFGEGVSAFIIADERDGMAVIWFYMLHHAQHTTISRLQLRDRLQHCSGLFTAGTLKSAGTEGQGATTAASLFGVFAKEAVSDET